MGKSNIDVVEIRSPFRYDRNRVSDDTGLKCLDESLTDQSSKDECDINTLVKRFGVTGTIPVLEKVPLNADFVGVTDYHSALNSLIEADNTFMELPADLRARFDHDAGKFVAFCSDDKNRDELIELGLIEKPEARRPVMVEIVPGAAAPGS